jgi:hypothetical protein
MSEIWRGYVRQGRCRTVKESIWKHGVAFEGVPQTSWDHLIFGPLIKICFNFVEVSLKYRRAKKIQALVSVLCCDAQVRGILMRE